MKTKCHIILFLLSFCLVTQAQINGIVVDKASRLAIGAVEVLELNTGESTSTNDKGHFTLNYDGNTEAELILFREGYEVKELQLNPSIDTLTIYLDKLAVELSALEITNKKKEIFATRKLSDLDGTTIYAGKKTEVVVMDLLNANLSTNVSRQVYAQIGGLNIYEGSDGGIQLNIGGRGLDPNRTSNFNTRQNGYDISADVLGYPENYYTPPTEALEEIRILRGASSLQYGTQFGGLVDFRIRRIPKYRTWDIRTRQTLGSFNFYSSFNSIGYRNKKIAVDIFYNHKQGDGYRANSEFNTHNLFAATKFFLSKKTQLELEFTYFKYLAKQAGGLTDQQFAENPRLSTRNRNWFDVDWKLYNLKFHHNFTSEKKLLINLFGLDATRSSVGYRGNPAALNENPITALDEQNGRDVYINPRDLIVGAFNNIAAEVKFVNNYKVRKVNAVTLVGIKYFNSNNNSQQGPGSNGVDADFNFQSDLYPDYANQSEYQFPNQNLALFAENIFYLSEKLSLTPGIRLEHILTKSEGQYNQLVFDLAGNPISNNEFAEDLSFSRQFILAGLGLDYKISSNAKLVANISQNYRSVTFSDIRVVNPSFIVDENITDEKGLSMSTGVSGRVNSKFSYDFNIYSILYNNRIGIILDDRANRVRTNIGDAIIVGTESLINYIPVKVIKDAKTHFQIKCFLNTAFTYSQYLDSKSNNVTGNQVEFIPQANIKAGISFSYKDLTGSIQHSYISQQYTDAQNSLIPVAGSLRSGIIGNIPAYNISDLSFRWKGERFTVDTGINNIFDEAYFTRRATGYPGPGIIPSEGRSYYLTLSYHFEK